MIDMQHKQSIGSIRFIIAALTLLFALATGSSHADNRQQFTVGFIAAVGVEKDEQGHPMLAEYDINGFFVADVGYYGLGELTDVTLYPAASWRVFQQVHQAILANNPELTRGAQLISADQYKSRQFSPRGNPGDTFTGPELLSNTKSVLVVSDDRILTKNPPKEAMVLAEYPVALHENLNVADDIVTLILNENGQIVRSSKFDVSLKAAIYRDPENRDRGLFDGNEIFWQPIPLAEVFAGGTDFDPAQLPGGKSVSEQDGRYSMIYLIPACPGFSYFIDVPIIAHIAIENFNPKSDDEQGFLSALRFDSKVCVGYGDIPIGANPLAIATQLNAQAIVATLAVPVYNVNVTFSTMQLNGLATIPDVGLKQGGDSVYEESAQVSRLGANDYQFDFNLDGEPDKAVENPNDPNKIDIYLSPNQPTSESGERNPPDFTRLADYALESQLEDQGLLEQISKDDLNDTDIYIYRRATGQLLGSIEGLDTTIDEQTGVVQPGGNNPTGRTTFRGIFEGEDDATFGFTSYLVGAVSSDLISGLINPERAGQINRRPWLPSEDNATGFASDNSPQGLRPGEIVQVIAINRATGYIGTQEITIQPSGTTLVPPTPLKMGPPNLKIIASREFKDYNEITRNEEDVINIIGSEGAGLTSDTYVKIQSVWLAANGDALPDNLPGYTGRVAISTGSTTTDFSGNFEIKTGYQTQLVQLNNANDLKREHFYVQVIGENFDGNPVFESPGAGAGKLQTRPKKYVPILVPLFDEQTTRAAEEALAIAKLDGLENLPERVEPTYRWVYRPEMQFSVYELDKQKLQFQNTQGDLEVFDLTRSGADAPILVLNDSLDPIDLLYDLIGPQSDALARFGPNAELVFTIGAEEVNATLTGNGNVRFNNVEHIASLAESDFLSIRLYSNNDSANVLWAYSVEYLLIEPNIIGYENQTEETYFITADENEVELKATVAGYASRPEADRYPGVMIWEAAGSGSFVETSQNSNESGVFDNTLVMPTVKGSQAEVLVSWRDARSAGNAELPPFKWKTVEVLAGKPARIEIVQSGQAVALEQGDLRLDFTIYDSFNNLVEDGTEVSFDFGDSLLVKDQQLTTSNGQAFVVLSGGEYAVPDTVFTVTSEEVSAETNISVAGLDVLLTGQTTLSKQETTNITVTVTGAGGSPAVGVPVELSAVKGIFADQTLITNSLGQVNTTFTAGLNEVNDSWIAQVGYAGGTEVPYSVQSSGSQSVNAEDAMLVADASQPGSINFDGYGIDIDIPYETEGTVSVRGSIGDTITIGDMADPNLEPLISLPLNDIDFDGLQGRFNDDHGLNSAFINRGHNINLDDDIVLVNDHPMGAGRSARFQPDSRITIEASDQIGITENSGFRLDIKPLNNGDIVSFDKDGLKLSFADDRLTLRVTTDSGNFSVSAQNVASDQWHSVAANVQGGILNLYVDGVIYSENFSGNLVQGNPLILDSKAVQVGGLEAVIRGFRIYDYGSLPLISFSDDSASTTLQFANEILVIKSLGNLGQLVENSQLASLRVALISDSERNYVSLLSQGGYQDIALSFLFTVSPEVPVAGIANPVPGLVPTAHAWSWSGVWDSVKATVSFIIPYEDFITIGKQLMYLANRDWENFDPVTLAFASLGAATIIPIVKPLKPLLGPIKKMVDAMRRFPAARHFAGAIGTAVKAAFSDRTEKIINLLPFILIAVELFKNPEVFEFVLEAIQSEEDLWIWVDFIAQKVTAEGGIDLANLGNSIHQQNLVAENPVPWAVDSAHAISFTAVSRIGTILRTSLQYLLSKFAAGSAFLITKALGALQRFPFLYRLAVKSVTLLRYLARIGGAKISQFVRNSRKWRVNRWFVLFAIVYLEKELIDGDLSLESDLRLQGLIAGVFTNNESNMHGSVYQLSQVAYYHALWDLDNSLARVIAIEGDRFAFHTLNGTSRASSRPYRRRIDIVLEKDNEEEWVELKSLDSRAYINSNFKFKGIDVNSYYREFLHDFRMNDLYITQRVQNRNVITNNGAFRTNQKYTWNFHNFNRGRGTSPTRSRFSRVPGWLCDFSGPTDNFFRHNLRANKRVLDPLCRAQNLAWMDLRSTADYIVEIAQALIDAGLVDAPDFIPTVEQITHPDWR